MPSFEERNGRQPGDPRKLADAIIYSADLAKPPARFLAGSVAMGAAQEKLAATESEADA